MAIFSEDMEFFDLSLKKIYLSEDFYVTSCLHFSFSLVLISGHFQCCHHKIDYNICDWFIAL